MTIIWPGPLIPKGSSFAVFLKWWHLTTIVLFPLSKSITTRNTKIHWPAFYHYVLLCSTPEYPESYQALPSLVYTTYRHPEPRVSPASCARHLHIAYSMCTVATLCMLSPCPAQPCPSYTWQPESLREPHPTPLRGSSESFLLAKIRGHCKGHKPSYPMRPSIVAWGSQQDLLLPRTLFLIPKD